MPAPLPSNASSLDDAWGVRRLRTVADHAARHPVHEIGNAWSRAHYGGAFHLYDPPADRPAIALVFVQTRNGNTGAHNPASLGGGPTDQYLIYEGLSRVAADGVLAGAGTIGHSVFFTVTHPELVPLRAELGLPRHPAQIVISGAGNIDLAARIFVTPEVPVFLLAGERCLETHAAEIRSRPWITLLPLNDDLPGAMRRLRREFGMNRVSAIGGRATATALVDAGLVQDIYLTTSPIDGGEPDTPWYDGDRPPRLDLIVSKIEDAPRPIRFEHLALS